MNIEQAMSYALKDVATNVKQKPVVSAIVGGIEVGMMPDGLIAIFLRGDLVACECEAVSAIPPSGIDHLVTLIVPGLPRKDVFRHEDSYYVTAGGEFKMLKAGDDCDIRHEGNNEEDFPIPPYED